MSASTTPSSESLERDAAALHTGHGKVDAGEIAIGVIIGRTSEFSTSLFMPSPRWWFSRN